MKESQLNLIISYIMMASAIASTSLFSKCILIGFQLFFLIMWIKTEKEEAVEW